MKKSASGSGERNLSRPGVRSVNAPREIKLGEDKDTSAKSSSRQSSQKSDLSRSTSSGRSSSSGSSYTSSYSAPSRAAARRKKKAAKKTGGIIALVLALLILAGGAAVYFLYTNGFFDPKYQLTQSDGTVIEMTEVQLRAAMETDKFVDGIIIDGVNVGGMTKDEAVAAVMAAQPEAPIDVDIKLEVGDEEIPLDLSDLTLESNVNEIIDTAYNYLRLTGTEDVNSLVTIYNAREALKNNPQTFNSAYTLNSDGVTTIVHNALDGLNAEPVNAEVLGFDIDTLEFQFTDSQKGYDVDVEGAINDVKALLDSGTYTGNVTVNAEILDPEFERSDLEGQFGMISSTSSTTTPNANRNHNINTACEKLNGHEVLPGEEFSFNGYVGRRTTEAGYLSAPVIANGTTEPGLGGGVCQVSTMVYQSAIKADLEITDRNNHLWPSSYAVAGTDATVDYDSNQDLKFVNTSDWPIFIVANWDASTSVVTVSFYGHLLENGEYIEFYGEPISSSSSNRTTYVADPTLPVGTTQSTGSVHQSVTAISYTIRYDRDGNEIERVDFDNTYYPGSSMTIRVGVQNPDGTTAPMDPNTGAVETTAPSETQPSETQPSETPASDTSASDTAASSETSATESSETAATSDTQATEPSETPAPAETPAPEQGEQPAA